MLIIELGINLDDPVGLPLPGSLWWQEDALFGYFMLACFIAPNWSFMWKDGVFEDAHPHSLVLIDFKLLDGVWVLQFCLLDHIHGICSVVIVDVLITN